AGAPEVGDQDDHARGDACLVAPLLRLRRGRRGQRHVAHLPRHHPARHLLRLLLRGGPDLHRPAGRPQGPRRRAGVHQLRHQRRGLLHRRLRLRPRCRRPPRGRRPRLDRHLAGPGHRRPRDLRPVRHLLPAAAGGGCGLIDFVNAKARRREERNLCGLRHRTARGTPRSATGAPFVASRLRADNRINFLPDRGDMTVSRRDFVGSSAAAAAFTIVPRHVLGGPGFVAPSDKLNIACIGVGGMGKNDVDGVSGENVYALCDVDRKAAEESFRNHPKAKRYTDYREMLDREAGNIDAVTVSTPDHVHAAAAMMALKLNKHTYCQKPLARTLHEVRSLAAQARTTKVSTQMGNQGHTFEGTRQLREYIEAGAIGTVREVHYWTNRPIWPQGLDRPTELHTPAPTLDWNLWLGPAADRPYHPAYAPFRWRGWWDFGTG